MLRRLGLAPKEEASKGASENGQVVRVASADPYTATRFFKVVWRGGVAVRASPNEPAPEGGRVSLSATLDLTLSQFVASSLNTDSV